MTMQVLNLLDSIYNNDGGGIQLVKNKQRKKKKLTYDLRDGQQVARKGVRC